MGKMLVFGHTITSSLYKDKATTKIWQQDHKIGMDGGATYGGILHGLIFNQTGIIQAISYPNFENIWLGER